VIQTVPSSFDIGIRPSAERSRIESRLLPSAIYVPSGERCYQMPLSLGPRWACTAFMRASVARSPQFARPLIPHMRLTLRFGLV